MQRSPCHLMLVLLLCASPIAVAADQGTTNWTPLTTDETKLFSRTHVGMGIAELARRFPTLMRVDGSHWIYLQPLSVGFNDRRIRRRFVIRDHQVAGVFTECKGTCVVVATADGD